MQKRHFQHAANMVRAILDGKWTTDFPDWAQRDDWTMSRPLGTVEIDTENLGNIDVNVTRAVWTAETFILLFTAYNPLFDQSRFLYACGLGPKPKRKPKGAK